MPSDALGSAPARSSSRDAASRSTPRDLVPYLLFQFFSQGPAPSRHNGCCTSRLSASCPDLSVPCPASVPSSDPDIIPFEKKANKVAKPSNGSPSGLPPGFPNPIGPAPPIKALEHLQNFVSQPVIAAFCAGGVAGAVSRTVVSPLERLKILFQVQSAGRNEYKLSVGKALQKMWVEEGWRGFMRGNGTNCIRIVPYSAVQFGSYNFYKRNFFESTPGADLSAAMRLTCGGLAGITSVTFTYPLDIVRTRLSIQGASFEGLKKGQGEKLPGMWVTMRDMYKTEGGFVALYRGIVPTVAGVAPYVGLNFMVYEQVRQYLTPDGDKNPSAVRKLAAGAISGAVAQTCTYPL